MPDAEDIYVELLNEGTTAWRPVRAVKLREGVYRIEPYDMAADDEEWAFPPGSVVRCELRRSSERKGKFLFAVALA